MRAKLVLFILASCHGGTAQPAAPGAGSGSAAVPQPAGTATTVGGFSGRTKSDLESIVETTRAVVKTDAFHSTLARLDDLHVSSTAGTMTGAEVDHLYAGGGDATGVPVRYKEASLWRRLTKDETAITDIDGNVAVTALHPVVWRRVRGSLEERACTINTIAHEWTHSVVRGGLMLFLDGNHEDAAGRFVSYTVGAVAQCVFLAQSRHDLDVGNCIAAAGTNSFQQCTCEPGWVDAFISGDTTCKLTD